MCDIYTNQTCLEKYMLSGAYDDKLLQDIDFNLIQRSDWLEQKWLVGLRRWHFLVLIAVLAQTLISLLCCCVRIRIPRTRMEIEADYKRRQLSEKFRKKLKVIHNTDMDHLDLQTALDRIRAEFRADSLSLAQSEAMHSSLPDDDASQDIRDMNSGVPDPNIGISFEDIQQEVARSSASAMASRAAGSVGKMLHPLKLGRNAKQR